MASDTGCALLAFLTLGIQVAEPVRALFSFYD